MENSKQGMLWIVMPVYNEEEAVPSVIEEWVNMLAGLGINYTFCILNDGSKDTTLEKLRQSEKEYPGLLIIDKKNSGHGQSCITGYKMGVEHNADWIFQIDSDGQCDPRYFKDFVPFMKNSKAIFGFRKTRADGFARYAISRVVSLFAYMATGVWLKDANVPYRLIHKDVMAKVLPEIPEDFYLANIFVSVLVRKHTPIKWVNIHFRDRSGGSPSIKTFSFAKHGMKLYRQLRNAVKRRTYE